MTTGPTRTVSRYWEDDHTRYFWQQEYSKVQSGKCDLINGHDDANGNAAVATRLAVVKRACSLPCKRHGVFLMLLHCQKGLILARRHAVVANKATPWKTAGFHSSRWCREQYFDASRKLFNDVALNERANDKVVLVDFYANWCGPCKMLSPLLGKLTEDSTIKTRSGRSLDLVTIDTDKELELAQEYKIRSLPTVMAFKNGKPVNQFVGALSEADVRKFLQQL